MGQVWSVYVDELFQVHLRFEVLVVAFSDEIFEVLSHKLQKVRQNN